MADLFLEWNQDLILTPGGSLQTAINWDQVRQRIIRNMITNSAQKLPDGSQTAPDYIFEPQYGIGMGAMVDQNPDASFLGNLKRRINQAVFADVNINPGVVPSIKIRQPTPEIFQIFIAVQLINGQPGEVQINLQQV